MCIENIMLFLYTESEPHTPYTHSFKNKDNRMYRLLYLPALVLALSACSSTPDNYAECILENMPGTSNEQSRHLIHSQCRATHPDMYYNIEKGAAHGLFNTKTEEDCMIEYGKNTFERYAVFNIRQACNCLYGEAVIKNQRCEYPKNIFDPSTARPITQ